MPYALEGAIRIAARIGMGRKPGLLLGSLLLGRRGA